MKKKTLLLLGAGIAAYLLYKNRSKIGLPGIGSYETVNGYEMIGNYETVGALSPGIGPKPWKPACGFLGSKCCAYAGLWTPPCRSPFTCKNGKCA